MKQDEETGGMTEITCIYDKKTETRGAKAGERRMQKGKSWPGGSLTS
jgi:hypothetical protein